MKVFSLLAVMLAFAAVARAEPPPGKNDDPIAARLFPPELIMKHQKELGVDDKQRDAIVAEVQKTQAKLVPLQWQMQGATEQMVKLLDGCVTRAAAMAPSAARSTVNPPPRNRRS